MKIGVYFTQSSAPDIYHIEVFRSWSKLYRELKRRYGTWVLMLLDKEAVEDVYINAIKRAVGECDVYLYLEMYDDYRE